MPTGSSVLMRGQSLQGSAFEANWKAFTIGSEHTELSGLGFSVTRQEGSIVQVAAGPVETVENDLFLGIGRQGVAAVGIRCAPRLFTGRGSLLSWSRSRPKPVPASATSMSCLPWRSTA